MRFIQKFDLKSSSLRLILGILVLFGVVGAAFAQGVRDKVLSRVTVTETESCAVATISFNVPVQATSYFPSGMGDYVRIDLNRINVGRVNGDGSHSAREELRPPSNKRAGIQEIQYDADAPTGPVLTVTFNRNRYFSISQGSDFRSLDLTIAKDPIDEACSGKSPRLRTGPEIASPKKKPQASSALHTVPKTLDANAVYAINLMSQQPEIKKSDLPKLEILSRYALYVVRFEEDGVAWNRLRLGFFKSRAEAQKVINALAPRYQDAWIARTTTRERESVYQAWLVKRQDAQKNVALIKRSPPVESLPTNKDAAALVAEARQLMSEGDNARAIQILTKALALEESQATPEARELLGLAREKNGQEAHAKAEYEEYLQRYPDADGAERVRQRLSALLTQGKDAPPELREGSAKNWVTRLTASLSQYYQRDETTVTLEQPELVPDPDKQVNRNAIVSGADITASVSNDRFDTTFRFSGTHTKDLMSDGQGDTGAISALYLDIADNAMRLALRLGRQNRTTGGVLGRFDGGLFSFDATGNIRINVVGGAPVIRSRDLFVDKDRKFVGGSVDVHDVVDGLDTTVYFINQTVDGLTDRQAAGFEFRYVDDSRTAFGLFDYDTFYDTINLALFNGSWRLKDNTTFNVAFDYRFAPSLFTIDALQGQGVETIDELRNIFTDDDIYVIAESRAARATSGTFTVSHPLSEKFQANASVTLANVGPTLEAGGVMAQPGTGVEKFYSTQIFGQGLIKDGDFATVGFRYDDMSTSRRYVVDLNTRYPFSRKFRISPRLRLSQRESTIADQTQFTFKPSMRINYIPSRLFQIELEGGGEWTTTNNPLDTEKITGYYFIGGYRLDF